MVVSSHNNKKLTKKEKRKLKLNGYTQLDTNHGLKLNPISPLTINQSKIINSFNHGKDLLVHGTAGTGKTFIGSFLALNSIITHEQYDKLVIFRSTVSTRDMGFLPGGKKEKTREYETPYIEICSELFGRGDAYAILEQKKIIQFEPTAFLRGLTFRNSVMLVDEIQNMNWQELSTILTRVGENCRVILCGDIKQPDLSVKDGRDDVLKLFKVCEHMNRFSIIKMEIGDIVRGGFVKDFIISCERLGY